MSPRQVVERWVEQFNAADADGLADLYHLDAVNHQVTQDPVEGRDASTSRKAGPSRQQNSSSLSAWE
jgi:ketosteroid isomerase-like protein